ncbi:P-loop containing nucleoside triphosphate hydrolase protein, partial [Bisporella sp. PMI_857]
GVGKTQLAAEYVHRFGSKFQVIIWITADDRVKVSDGLANAASDLALGGCNAVTDSTIATKAIQSWLKQTGMPIRMRNGSLAELIDEPWLLVFDNVDDMALLRDFWPLRSRGNVILTSRDPFTSFESQITHSIRLEPLSKEQSFELFCKITRHDINTKCPPQLDHFLDDWGGLPIALAQIGGFVRENGLTWQDFIGLYAENAPLLHAHRLETWQYEHSIATAFSIDRLDITAKGILWALTFLDPEKIPNELLMLA